MSTDKPHKTLIIDAHMISLFRDCEEKYNKRINQLLVTKKSNGAMGSGIAFHEGVATYRQMRKVENRADFAFNGGLYKLREAYKREMPPEFTNDLSACPDERRSLPNLERVFEAFIEYEEMQKFEYLYIEQSMAISLGSIERPNVIWDIVYAGIVDAIVKQQGAIFVDDLKTTTMNISQPYKDGFRLSQAMKGYVVGMKSLLKEEIYGAMISIAWLQKEAKSGKGKPLSEYFHTVPLTFTPDQLDEWHSNTLRTINKVILATEQDDWQLAFSSACTYYSGCTFKEVCWATPGSRERVIEMDFERKTWTPLEEVRSKAVSEEEWKRLLVRRSIGGDDE